MRSCRTPTAATIAPDRASFQRPRYRLRRCGGSRSAGRDVITRPARRRSTSPHGNEPLVDDSSTLASGPLRASSDRRSRRSPRREPSVHERTIGLRHAPASVEGSTAAIASGFDALRYCCGAGGACLPRAASVVWDQTRRITSETAGDRAARVPWKGDVSPALARTTAIRPERSSRSPRCGAFVIHRSGSAVDLLPAGIVQRLSAFTECCRANAAPGPEVPSVIGASAWRRAYGRRASRRGRPTTSAAG